MEDNIITKVLQNMMENNFWFTTKNDPTFEEPSSYYELDKYGDPTPKTITKIIDEVQAKIGDGAVDLDDAIDLWITEAATAYKIAYTDCLITNFEAKPVVDQIEAYEVAKLQESAWAKIALENALDDMTEADNNIATVYFADKNERAEAKEYYKSLGLESWNGYTQDKGFKNRYTLHVKVEDRSKLQESVKTRLKEESNKSLNIISDKLADPNFDADSEAGQIILRTSDLFNKLSDKGYDVQVNFDNGDSQSTILLGQQGGQVEITINDSKSSVRAFSSGNIEINEDVINTFNDIYDIIKDI